MANLWLMKASKPTPATLSEYLSPTFMTSIVLVCVSFIMSMASVVRSGMSSSRASPLPEPHGIIPRAVELLMSAEPISLTVPSPPTAMTASIASLWLAAISVAWPAWVVCTMSNSISVLFVNSLISFSIVFFFPTPECGFITYRICFLSMSFGWAKLFLWG